MGSTPAQDDDAETAGLRVFHTGSHPCGYWPEREARDLVLDPRDERLPRLYPLALAGASAAPATSSIDRTAAAARPASRSASRSQASPRIAASVVAWRAMPTSTCG